MKRVAIYCRVSTEDQTLDQQRIPLVEMCKKEGWYYQVFEEKVSGAKGSKDKKKRCKSGYYTKWSQKKAPLGIG